MKKRSNRLLSRRRKARPLLAEVGTAGGFVSTLLFALYNGGLGVWYASLWYGSICAYYILLSLLGLIILFMLFVPMMKDSAMKVFIYYTPC